MASTLFILNDAPYGNERAYNALRLAAAMAGKDDQQVRLFLMADAVACAKGGQKVPEGYYNVQLMLGKVLRKGEVALCGTCMDTRGLRADEVIEGAAPWHSWPTGPSKPTRCWSSSPDISRAQYWMKLPRGHAGSVGDFIRLHSGCVGEHC